MKFKFSEVFEGFVGVINILFTIIIGLLALVNIWTAILIAILFYSMFMGIFLVSWFLSEKSLAREREYNIKMKRIDNTHSKNKKNTHL